MSGLAEELLALEREGWDALSGTAGAAYYEEHMADDGLMVFGGGIVMSKTDVLASIARVAPWTRYRIEAPRTLALGADAGALIYRAVAQRAGQPEFRASISSVYVRRSGRWLLALHQQSPD